MHPRHLALLSIVLAAAVFLFGSHRSHEQMLAAYEQLISRELLDRDGKRIAVSPNARGMYATPARDLPENLRGLLIQKEDRFFFIHPGFNPFSIARDLASSVLFGRSGGSSTITQQTVKILLGNENNRSLPNKLRELWYALALEAWNSKTEIVDMYATVAYFGGGAQGVEEAARRYFGISAGELKESEFVLLLAALSDPRRTPGTNDNARVADVLSLRLSLPPAHASSSLFTSDRVSPAYFEWRSLSLECSLKCITTIDRDLTEKLRALLRTNLDLPAFGNARNGAIAVIKLPENELIALVGSPDPAKEADGYKINMAIEPRAVGSTIKPFIYAKAFEKGARPYTETEDREYQYESGLGYPFYPKNYDGAYRGTVTLHEALVNSLNIPSVQVLSFVGIPEFGKFLENDLLFSPIQPIEEYGLGVALGALEMDLLTLTHYFTVFPQNGILHPLVVIKQGGMPAISLPMQKHAAEGPVLRKEASQLVTRILSDRSAGVDQFGLRSNLSLPSKNYAVKTGTSRDYHDSWAIGYTPDFVVGVWVGNSDNSAMREVTGQSGAGKIWGEAMNMLLASSYNKKREFDYSRISAYPGGRGIEYGLPGDDYERMRKVMRTKPHFIENAYEGEIFLFDPVSPIPLRGSGSAEWRVNGAIIGHGAAVRWLPLEPGTYTIEAGGDSIQVEVRPLP